MIPATWQHAIAAVFSFTGVSWLKARGMVQEYPGTFLVVWAASMFAAGWWL